MAKKEKTNPNIFQGFAPRQNRVLVRVDEAITKTPAGLIIPDTVSVGEKPNSGTVLAIGPRVDDLDVGDRVLYGQHSGFDVNHMGIDYKLIRADDAFAQIKQ